MRNLCVKGIRTIHTHGMAVYLRLDLFTCLLKTNKFRTSGIKSSVVGDFKRVMVRYFKLAILITASSEKLG